MREGIDLVIFDSSCLNPVYPACAGIDRADHRSRGARISLPACAGIDLSGE